MRRIIICNDGTWNSPDDTDRGKTRPTNITKISRAILPQSEDGISQIVFYNEGVGTGFGEKIIGGITGYGLSKNILDSYRFLAHNYHPGDEIYLFGFSRGAFTTRSLSNFIAKVGMIEKGDVFFLSHLYELYKQEATTSQIESFYQKHNIQRHSARIKFIGVFDTVGALGIPIPGINKLISKTKLADFQFHVVELADIVDFAFHALALDEQRKPFAPTLWESKPTNLVGMEQRWFAGVHSNSGGGYNPDDLANMTLKYMVSKAKLSGLQFDGDYLAHFGGNVDEPIRDSMSFKYRLVGKNIRKVTLNNDSNQVVDESVFEKIQHRQRLQTI